VADLLTTSLEKTLSRNWLTKWLSTKK
jgi:hypothetical protein